MKKIIIAAVLIFTSFIITSPKNALAATNVIDVWWPTNNATLNGTTPFKAMLENADVNTYSMYWQVDGGQLNIMSNNSTDYPHKEVTVDLSGWNWHNDGQYVLTFVAKDQSGNLLTSKNVTIHVSSTLTVATSNTPISTSSTFPTTTAPTVVTSATPVATVAPAVSVVNKVTQIWWPTNGSSLTGSQPFKAMVTGLDVSQYSMYWQVDGGQLNVMSNNSTDYPHKEVTVDLSGWNWKGSGPYTITFVAKDAQGNEIGRTSSVITIAGAPTTPSITPTVTTAQNPLSSASFYVKPSSDAKNQASIWRISRPADAAVMDKLALQPDADWIGNWNSNVQSDVNTYVSAAVSKGQVPVLISYNIPGRDCGSYSAGGANSPAGYQTWISQVAAGISNRKTVVILEPDALAGITCLSSQDQATRTSLIKGAVSTLKSAGAIVYIDAGNSSWVSAQDMSTRLINAGISQADGFALNVSNFYTTNDNENYGIALSKLVGNKHFVIDTSRNGNGSNGQWCNPLGRAVGQSATANTGNPLVDAFLWLKVPGESDGACNGGPSAGTWWPDYALNIAKAAGY